MLLQVFSYQFQKAHENDYCHGSILKFKHSLSHKNRPNEGWGTCFLCFFLGLTIFHFTIIVKNHKNSKTLICIWRILIGFECYFCFMIWYSFWIPFIIVIVMYYWYCRFDKPPSPWIFIEHVFAHTVKKQTLPWGS